MQSATLLISTIITMMILVITMIMVIVMITVAMEVTFAFAYAQAVFKNRRGYFLIFIFLI